MKSSQNKYNQSPALQSSFLNRIWWLALAGLLGFFIYFKYDSQVFPSASINLQMPRARIVQIAKNLAKELNYDDKKAIKSTQFTLDSGVKTFLEYELGIPEANKLMKDQIPVWSWRTRFCKQYEQEEFRIWLSPAGQLNGFIHELENDRQLPSLSKDQACALAKKFIANKTNLSLDTYTLVKSAAFSQSHRTDYSFTWQDNSHDYHGAKLRIQVGIAGNLVDQFNYFLYVPESFERKFSTVRSYNDLFQGVAAIFYSLLQVVSVFIFLWAVSTKRIRWRFAITVAAIVTSIEILESFNNIASVIDSYNTQKLFLGYLVEFIVQAAVSCLLKFLSTLMLIGSAELVYRLVYPKKIACENFVSNAGYRSKTIIQGNLIGHCLLGIDLGWIVAYYLSGPWWHVWCPSGVDNYQVLSTVVPCFSAIATGVAAAVGEEFLFRALALGLFQRIFRFFWLANILQAAAWGFMHSSYPQEPAYARGLELTVVGVIHGWILRRYGLFPCLISHYLFDALISVKPLFGAQDFWLKTSAFIPVLPFFLLLGITYWLGKKYGYTKEKALQNRHLILSGKAEIPFEDDKEIEITKSSFGGLLDKPFLSEQSTWRLAVLSIVCLILLLPCLNYSAVNKNACLKANRNEIILAAKKEMMRQNINPQGYRAVASLIDETNSLEMQYIYEQVRLKKTLDIAPLTEQGLFWRVRFFKILEAKEYEIWLDTDGKIIDFALSEPEDVSGARLPAEVAKSKAEAYLKTQHSNWQPYKFESFVENNRKARTDYTFIFTVPFLKVGEADFKVSVGMIGDVISGVDAGYDLPDHWLNERNKRTLRHEIFQHLRTVFNVTMFLAVTIWAFALLKKGQIKWKQAYFVALPLVGLSFIQQLNNYPQFYRSYVTTLPQYSYVLRQITAFLQQVQGSFLYYFCGFALSFAALYTLKKNYDLKHFFLAAVNLFDKHSLDKQKTLWLSSWIIACAAISLHALINAISDFFRSQFSPACPQESLSDIYNMANLAWPWLAIFTDSISAMATQLMLVGIFGGLYKRYCRNFTFYLLFIILLNLVSHSSVRYWQDYVIDVVSSSVWEIIIWYFIVKIIGFNPLPYCLIGLMDGLFSNLLDLIQHAWPIYKETIIFALLILIAPLLYFLYLSLLDGKVKKINSVN